MRIELNNFSLDQRRAIGNRIRGARIMSGLTQEEFASKYSISLSTLKNFEIARVIPRISTVMSIISAIRAEGINLNEDWIIYGRSRGDNGSLPSILRHDESIMQEIGVLKQHFIDRGLNPLSAIVKNNDMAPKYLEGDVLLGLPYNLDPASFISGPFLIERGEDFVPFTIIAEGKSFYATASLKNSLMRLKNERIAQIVWHRQYS